MRAVIKALGKASAIFKLILCCSSVSLMLSLGFCSGFKNDESIKSHVWQVIKGQPAPNMLQLGMYSFHMRPGSKDDRANNDLLAFSYHGYFASTLLNSFDKRAFAIGFDRQVWSNNSFRENVSLGYELGLIIGYDKRLMSLAKDTPILPLPILYTEFRFHRVGIKVSWCFQVFSISSVINI